MLDRRFRCFLPSKMLLMRLFRAQTLLIYVSPALPPSIPRPPTAEEERMIEHMMRARPVRGLDLQAAHDDVDRVRHRRLVQQLRQRVLKVGRKQRAGRGGGDLGAEREGRARGRVEAFDCSRAGGRGLGMFEGGVDRGRRRSALVWLVERALA